MEYNIQRNKRETGRVELTNGYGLQSDGRDDDLNVHTRLWVDNTSRIPSAPTVRCMLNVPSTERMGVYGYNNAKHCPGNGPVFNFIWMRPVGL